MACNTTYEHNFVKLAEEAGFSFNIHRPRIRIDWNKIRSIDIDRVITERRFVTIEQHLSDILDCLLESEFDCRILDEGVVKLFRLAQLAVEYQQFCRHHLNKSVMLLREELASVMQELDKQKRNIRSKDDELKKIRKKVKHNHKPIIPSFGNENIAAMIIKTLTNNENIASPDLGDGIQQYNKCKYCDKVFLNQLYLKGHMIRRHQALIDQDQLIAANNKIISNQQESKTEQENQYLSENIKLQKEIELKNRLQDVNTKLEATQTKLTEIDNEKKKEIIIPEQEVANTNNKIQNATENQENILEKMEEWKIKEQEKYKVEINLIKEQILENINAFNIKQNHNNIDVVQQFRNTIQNQNLEIASLKQELLTMTENINKINKIRDLEYNKILENHFLPRVSKVDAEQQYENSEGLPKKIHKNEIIDKYVQNPTEISRYTNSPQKKLQPVVEQNYNPRIQKITDRQKSLEELHRKTQELLNIEESSTDSSCSTEQNLTKNKDIESPIKDNLRLNNKSKSENTNYKVNKHLVKHNPKNDSNCSPKNTKKKSLKKKTIPKKYNEDLQSDDNPEEIINTSPAKIVRAKITEEVHKRLVLANVDPLKTGVNNLLFEKQRTRLRQDEEIKKKKSPSYEKVKHKILAYLDSKVAETLETHPKSNTIVENKRAKNFKIASVLSNVKNKALSFIKSNDKSQTLYSKSRSEDITQSANYFFKTPPSSIPDSPINHKRASRASTDSNHSTPIKKNNKPSKKTVVVEVNKHKMNDSDSDGIDSIDVIYNEKKSFVQKSKSIDNLINSPIKKPYKTNEKNSYNSKSLNNNHSELFRTQSTSGLPDLRLEEEIKDESIHFTNRIVNHNKDFESSDKVPNTNLTKYLSDDNVFLRNTENATKGVLKNAPSTSSLSKKKVIFDLDANQTKSVSASPSQSNTEKSDVNAEDAIETLNLEEEWDISSIESVPVNASKENLTSSKTTPKIAELTQRIESQLAMRRDNKPPVGSIDVLRGLPRGGSNTSLGSSLPDDSDEPRRISSKSILLDKDASDIDLSEFSLDGISKDYKVNVK